MRERESERVNMCVCVWGGGRDRQTERDRRTDRQADKLKF